MRILVVEGSAQTLARVLAEGAVEPRRIVEVRDSAGAASAIRAALGGGTLIVHAVAERSVLDRLYDDLRRLGDVAVRTDPSPSLADGLSADEAALLRALADGRTLRDAAATLHLSLRTADRRLAAARMTLGAATTTEAVRAFVSAARDRG